ncbi:MAG: hypothetical protein QF704_00075 [Anaerolineales bacterium]|jgi:hypothetical protein|nr:hypothetical protein [Anaerolineales bacterium]
MLFNVTWTKKFSERIEADSADQALGRMRGLDASIAIHLNEIIDSQPGTDFEVRKVNPNTLSDYVELGTWVYKE